MNKYAPAPWSFDEEFLFIRDADKDQIGQLFVSWLDGEQQDKERALANARLIAAAPELHDVVCKMAYIFMQVVEGIGIDIETTRFEATNKSSGETMVITLEDLFNDAATAIDKVSGKST